MTMLLIELVLAFVLTTILPHIVSVTVHHTVLELSLEVAAVSPLEATKAAHFITTPCSRVLTTIGPVVDTFTFFDPCAERAMIVASIAPYLDAFSVLLSCNASEIRLGLR